MQEAFTGRGSDTLPEGLPEVEMDPRCMPLVRARLIVYNEIRGHLIRMEPCACGNGSPRQRR